MEPYGVPFGVTYGVSYRIKECMSTVLLKDCCGGDALQHGGSRDLPIAGRSRGSGDVSKVEAVLLREKTLDWLSDSCIFRLPNI